jgi:uncharacterized membrane protein SpoIIM required for sporulation
MKRPFNEKDWEYFRELKPHMGAIILVLALGIAAGIFLASFSPESKPEIIESLRGTARFLLGLPKVLLALGIFLNNSVKTFLVIVSGVLLGVVPVLFILANGFAIGFLMHLSTESTGWLNSLLAIVPHGVFELPGVLLGASIGLMLGTRAIRRLWGKTEPKPSLEFGQAFVTSALVTRSTSAMRPNPPARVRLQAEMTEKPTGAQTLPPLLLTPPPHNF